MTRPSIVDTMLAVASTMADRSTCSRRHNGAVVATSSGVVLSTGYNGSLSGMQHCKHECTCNGWTPARAETVFWDAEAQQAHQIRCPASVSTCPTAVHAEANAVYFAARNGVKIENAIIYCTTEPCRKCAEAIVQSGITECVYSQGYRTHEGIDLLRVAGVMVAHYYSKEPLPV